MYAQYKTVNISRIILPISAVWRIREHKWSTTQPQNILPRCMQQYDATILMRRKLYFDAVITMTFDNTYNPNVHITWRHSHRNTKSLKLMKSPVGSKNSANGSSACKKIIASCTCSIQSGAYTVIWFYFVLYLISYAAVLRKLNV